MMAHKGFDRAFKLEAIGMASEAGIKASEVERRLGISKGMISRWKRQLREEDDDAFPGTGHVRPSEVELRDLRRENERLRRERDILKKAVVIFSEKG
ncbi:MAG: transposase [Gemmatimonadetes bacterium]|nr:transposase [Gemmatimonadota bacterium]